MVEQPRVAAAALDPRAQRRRPVLARRVRPAHEDRREAAFLEVRGRGADDVPRHAVALHAAVAEEERGLGRHHVRRVRGDEVEALARGRLEEAPGAELDVLDAVERGVEGGEVERALVEVGREHVPAVPRGEDRLDARAGADVERGLDRPAHGQVRERERRPVHAGDVVRRLLVLAASGGRRRSGSRRGGRCGRAASPRRRPTRRARAPASRSSGTGASARCGLGDRHESSSTNSLTIGPSGSTPASRRSCTAMSRFRASSSPPTPSTWRRLSPVSPRRGSTSPSSAIGAAIVRAERARDRSVGPCSPSGRL